ncbi:MAG: hypothetical protein AB7H97_18025, partial [Pseudobdellovibrionaceae bacterium]
MKTLLFSLSFILCATAHAGSARDFGMITREFVATCDQGQLQTRNCQVARTLGTQFENSMINMGHITILSAIVRDEAAVSRAFSIHGNAINYLNREVIDFMKTVSESVQSAQSASEISFIERLSLCEAQAVNDRLLWALNRLILGRASEDYLTDLRKIRTSLSESLNTSREK